MSAQHGGSFENKMETEQLEDKSSQSAAADSLPNNTLETEGKPTWRAWGITALCAFHTMSSLFVFKAVGVSIASIVAELGNPSMTIWFIAGPTLVQTALSPIVARFSDLTGERKWFIVVPTAFGVVGGIIAATAQSMNAMIGGMLIMGIAFTPVGISTSIPSEIVPHRYRAIAQGTVLWGGNLSSLLGTFPTGAILRQHGGWRGNFWMMTAFWGTTVVGFVLLYKPAPKPVPNRTFRQLCYEADALGCIGLGVSLGLMLLGLTWTPSKFAWTSVGFLAPFILGFAGILLFCLYEWKGRSDGILDHQYFRIGRNFGIGAFAMFVEGWIYFGGLVAYLPQQIRAVGFSSDPLMINSRVFIFNATGFLASLVLVWYVTRSKDMKWPLVGGFILFLVAVIMYSQIRPGGTGSTWDKITMGSLTIGGIGFSAPLVLINAVVQLSTPPELIATATALVAAGRSLGGSVGGVVFSNVYNAKVQAELTTRVGAVALPLGLPESSLARLVTTLRSRPAAIATVPGVTPAMIPSIMSAYQHSTAQSYSYAWYTVIPFIFLAIVSVALLKPVKKEMNWKIDRSYEGTAARRVDEESDTQELPNVRASVETPSSK